MKPNRPLGTICQNATIYALLLDRISYNGLPG